MIIECPNCNKKFELNSELIPAMEELFSVVLVIMFGFFEKKKKIKKDRNCLTTIMNKKIKF